LYVEEWRIRIMAKPVAKPAPTAQAAPQPAASKPIARTEVRNSPLPKAAVPAAAPAAKPGVAAKAITHDLIARRAYEIWASGNGGSDFENWTRAERELRGV
jgi:hypothetical protein